MGLKLYFLLLFVYFARLAADTCFFIPPTGWEIADPETLAPRVEICFLGKSSKGLAPSVNLATESVNVSLEAYVEAVRKIHKADPNSHWRDLGKFKTPMGEGRLTELESPTDLGRARLVQLIVIKNQTAYVLTAAALKEEFSKYYKTFDQVFRSLQLSSNLLESYPSKSQQLLLHQLIQSLENRFLTLLTDQTTAEKALSSEPFYTDVWEPFEKKMINTFTEMGPYWQILVLSEIRTKLLTTRSK